MGTKLSKAPIFYSLSQIRFNAIVEMPDYIRHLQKNWRARYPDFSTQSLNQLQFQLPALGQQPELKQSALPRWLFKNTEQDSGYILTTDSIVFHTTKYETSEKFFAELLSGLQSVHELVPLSYIESISCRTLDAVTSDSQHELSFFLNPHLLGLSSQLGGELKHSTSELVIIKGEEQLTTRIALLNGKLGLPADLFPLQLRLSERVQQIDAVHAILDNDCVYRRRFAIDFLEAAQVLRTVKDSVSESFRKSVTQAAFDYWR